MTTTMPLLPTLTRTRRRFLGSAAMTLLAARLGMTGSARAHTAKESTMTMTLTERDTVLETAPPSGPSKSTCRRQISTISASASPRRAGPARSS